MSVSIHRIYSSETLIFFFLLAWHSLPQRKKFAALTGTAFSRLRTDWDCSSSQPGRTTLCGARTTTKKKRFQSADIVALKANMHLIHFDIYKI